MPHVTLPKPRGSAGRRCVLMASTTSGDWRAGSALPPRTGRSDRAHAPRFSPRENSARATPRFRGLSPTRKTARSVSVNRPFGRLLPANGAYLRNRHIPCEGSARLLRFVAGSGKRWLRQGRQPEQLAVVVTRQIARQLLELGGIKALVFAHFSQFGRAEQNLPAQVVVLVFFGENPLNGPLLSLLGLNLVLDSRRLEEGTRLAMTEQPMPLFLIVADHDQGFFSVEGPMTDDRPWQNAARHARDQLGSRIWVRAGRRGSERPCR
jgi:hypothetical protein